MGQHVGRTTFSRRDRQEYRAKVQRCLDTLAVMLRERTFARDEPMTGLEVELNLVDHELQPSLAGAQVLAALGAGEFQSELGRWNLELNLPPRPLPGDQWRRLESHLLDELATVRASALDHGAQLAVIGILPTLEHRHLGVDVLSPDERYTMLNEQMLAARGEPVRLDIAGDDPSGRHTVAPEHLVADFDSIAPEAACTSMQLHLQVHPDSFAAYWNAAQCLAGVQLAVGANSPFLLGSRLWAETRIPLFEQSCDVRTPELRNQGVRPRVWFGERWITSVLDLFAENGRYFPALMPVSQDGDPVAELESGGVPGLDELRMHNGTIWRWNRPVYDIADGVPHIRVENRVLPAGPTVVDMVANALFFYGLLRELVEAERPLWSSMSFEAAEENFTTAARHGLDGPLYWPGTGWMRPDELVLRKLLPQAAAGLARWGVSADVVDRYLSVIERRCVERRTGASWQLDTVAALEARGADRPQALRGMLARYLESSAANEPVHGWDVPAS
ncbi:MAG: glutamate--cysteine ligase [Pseudonocardia sp.]|nr:glutamate--cysteine ligase [Pseudonocardia sp.]